jgi:hypothetical protein
MLMGGCQCGAVRFEIDADRLRHITHCHCGMCRKIHGAAFATYAPVPRRRFRVVSGSDTMRSYRSSERVTREFCVTCGCPLLWSTDAFADWVAIPLGALDDDPGGKPEAHIFVANRASWFEIADSLPQHEGAIPFR